MKNPNGFSVEVKEAARWIEQQLAVSGYAEVGVKFVIHDGQIRRVDYCSTIKIQPHNTASLNKDLTRTTLQNHSNPISQEGIDNGN